MCSWLGAQGDCRSERTFQCAVGTLWRWAKRLHGLNKLFTHTFPIDCLCLKHLHVQMHRFLPVCLNGDCRDLKTVRLCAIVLLVNAALCEHNPAVNAEGIDHSAQRAPIVHHRVLPKEDALSRSTPVNSGHAPNGRIHAVACATNSFTRTLKEPMRFAPSSRSPPGGGTAP